MTQFVEYWEFVEQYYPNYYSCDKILRSDILTRKLNNEEISEQDENNLKGINIKKELFELDLKILTKALESYFAQAY